jgi:hypothetical protein
MSDERRNDDTSVDSEDFVTLNRDTISDLQERFGLDMRVRSRRGPISRVIKAAAPVKPPAGPKRQGGDYDRDNYDRDGNYDRDDYDRDHYDKNDYDKDDYDRDHYDRDKPGYDREDYDRDSPH